MRHRNEKKRKKKKKHKKQQQITNKHKHVHEYLSEKRTDKKVHILMNGIHVHARTAVL